MGQIFVKAHRRGNSLIKAYAREVGRKRLAGTVQSSFSIPVGESASLALAKIVPALKKKYKGKDFNKFLNKARSRALSRANIF